MIVDTMTHEEVFAELAKDRENVERWYNHRADEFHRMALKTHKFPVTWQLDYTSPRKNRYLISVTCTRRNYDRYHAICIMALRREERGYTAYLSHIGTETLIRKTVFLQHVFDRYAERLNVNKQGIDIIQYFLNNHTNGHILENHQLAGRSVRYNGRNHRFVAGEDGVLLGDIENGIFVFRTFITYEMATGLQREEFVNAKSKLYGLEEEIQRAQMMRSMKPKITINIM